MILSLNILLQHLLATSSLFPFWSYLVHFTAAAALVLLQNMLSLSKTLDPYFFFFNEFFASVVWNIWSLENAIVCCMWSGPSCFLILGLRLFLGPLVLRQAHVNPCSIFFSYLSNSQPGAKNGRVFLLLFLAELLAIPAGLAFAMAIWNFLKESGLSDDHTHFLQEKVEFLSVPPFTGFMIEIFVTFVMLVPGVFFFQSTRTRIAETFFVLSLIFQFGPHTGAFMNPMVAMSYLLMWHYGDTHSSTLAVHLFVFWVGPLVGTVMAVGMARLLPSKLHEKLL